MSDILSKDLKVLKLNKHFWAVGFESVSKAFSEMCSRNKVTGKSPRLGMDIVYAQREDGTYDTTTPLSYRPVTMEEWLLLPVRSCDLAINCNHRMIRVPTVTVCSNFKNIPDKAPKFSPEAIRAREGGRCIVTGRVLAPGEGDLGHDVAKTKGGRKTWTNVGYMTKGLNRAMGTKTFAEAGYPHVKAKMTEPKRTKVLLTSKDVYHEDQLHFVN